MVGKDLIMATLFGSGGGSSGSGGGGWPEAPDDGKTRLYIYLSEGRTSPMLGVYVRGTVTVDWGDGSATDTLTGDSGDPLQWTNNHNYSEPGYYVITLTVEGEAWFGGNVNYQEYAYLLRKSSAKDITNVHYQMALRKAEIGDNFADMGAYGFAGCHALSSVKLPDYFTNIFTYAFYNCYSISRLVAPANLASIASRAFYGLMGITCYDFTACTSVPALASTDAFTMNAADFEIRVPAALYDEWIAATNWATYASQIKAY